MPRVNYAPCSRPGCSNPKNARGLCSTHYHQAKAAGLLPSRRTLTESERFFANVSPEPNTGCWLWTASVNSRGYGVFTRADWRYVGAHRFAWEEAHGPIASRETFVCHHCDNPACVNPDHLFLGTSTDNNRDMVAKRRNTRRLSEEIVAELRRMVRAGSGVSEAADRLGVPRATASHAVIGRRWTHVSEAPAKPPPTRGERNYKAKLNDRTVRCVRALRDSGEKMEAIARAFGVSAGAVAMVVSGRTWRHVEGVASDDELLAALGQLGLDVSERAA